MNVVSAFVAGTIMGAAVVAAGMPWWLVILAVVLCATFIHWTDRRGKISRMGRSSE